MKKMISIIAVAALTFALTACGGSSQAAATDTQAAENSHTGGGKQRTGSSRGAERNS